MASFRFFDESESAAAKFQHLEIQDSDLESDETLLDLYKRWMSHYEVPRTRKHKKKRFDAFKENVKYVHMENKMDNPYKLGLNSFSDMTLEEFERSNYLGSYSSEKMIRLYGQIKQIGRFLSERKEGPNFDGYNMVPAGDEEARRSAVAKHSSMALIDCRGNAFKNYREGVLTVEAGKAQNGFVCITGSDETPDGLKYWRIQNTWGQNWGDGGCVNIQRGVNLCGVASFVSHPTVAE